MVNTFKSTDKYSKPSSNQLQKNETKHRSEEDTAAAKNSNHEVMKVGVLIAAAVPAL